MNSLPFHFSSIGTVHSPYKEKFGIPRQPGLTPSIRGKIEILPEHSRIESFRGLEGFSHIWIQFVFHQNITNPSMKTMVRPPRLGGNEKVGCYASRSPYRPNPIGLSVVKLERIVEEQGKIFLEISNHDLLDQTPVLDIKPYLAYSDSLPNAVCGFASHAPEKKLTVQWSEESLSFLNSFFSDDLSSLYSLQKQVEELVVLDPRPASQRKDGKRFGVAFSEWNVRFSVQQNNLTIEKIEKKKSSFISFFILFS